MHKTKREKNPNPANGPPMNRNMWKGYEMGLALKDDAMVSTQAKAPVEW